MHWKEGEPVWRKRRSRVALANAGLVPAYATSAGGASEEVEPDEPKRARRRITAPEDPNRALAPDEFQDLVADLGLEEDGAKAATATAEPDDPVPGSGADLTPEDLVLKDDPKTPKPKRPRNRRHGR